MRAIFFRKFVIYVGWKNERMIFFVRGVLWKKKKFKRDRDLCSSCGSYLDNSLDTCSKCLPEQHLWDSGFCCFLYRDRTRKAIYQFKYSKKIILALPLARKMAQVVKNENFDCITYVPKFWLNKVLSGYNQSQILAQTLAKELAIPHKKLLSKLVYTKRQAKLDKKDRLKNLKGAFTVRQKIGEVKSILLVDDVLTTGTTLSLCSEQLKKAGAKKVSIVTLTRG